MVKAKGEDCGFCKHWAQYHKDSSDDLTCLKIVFLDQIDDPGPKEEDFPHLKKIEGTWMANLGQIWVTKEPYVRGGCPSHSL